MRVHAWKFYVRVHESTLKVLLFGFFVVNQIQKSEFGRYIPEGKLKMLLHFLNMYILSDKVYKSYSRFSEIYFVRIVFSYYKVVMESMPSEEIEFSGLHLPEIISKWGKLKKIFVHYFWPNFCHIRWFFKVS